MEFLPHVSATTRQSASTNLSEFLQFSFHVSSKMNFAASEFLNILSDCDQASLFLETKKWSCQ